MTDTTTLLELKDKHNSNATVTIIQISKPTTDGMSDKLFHFTANVTYLNNVLNGVAEKYH